MELSKYSENECSIPLQHMHGKCKKCQSAASVGDWCWFT